ncbi:MAG: 2Fe-2S iron-sulfur cluster-binding protein [Sinimarinibacterium sp.]|jgi:2Fe-2S ferredoxin
MAQVTYVDLKDDRRYTVDVEGGATLMQAAVDNLVPRVMGDCGGACACGTCHVYVDAAWVDRVGLPSGSEAELLSGLLETQPNSRLACQIAMNEGLHGLVLRLPDPQL